MQALILSLTVSCGASGSQPSSSTPTTAEPSQTETASPAPTASPTPAPNYVVRGNLDRSRQKLEQSKTGRVAFLGGSVTNLAWREKVMAYLTQRFPRTTFDFINAGMNGTPAELGAFRLEEDVFSHGPVDLLFLEFAVNGGSLEAMEGIVRHARALSPNIDIVQMHIAAKWFGDGLDKGELPGTVIVHEQVAEHYGNCSIYLYKEIYERVKAGEFTWDQFSADGVHPNEFGSTVYADFIDGFLETMWSRADETPVAYSMPAALTAAPWEHAALISYTKASSTQGFKTVKDWTIDTNIDFKGPVSFIASSTPGSTVSFSFRGTIVGLYEVAGPDSALVDYRIDGGAWAELDTSRDSMYPSDWYRLNGIVLSTSLSDGAHSITFRTKTDAGHFFRLYRLMVG
jgi:lysophospholipase L1-like esterase